MKDKNLIRHLENFKKEIADIDEKDQAVRAKLRDLAEAIQQKLDNPKDKEQHSAVLSRLEKDVVAFKVKHPLISAELERLIDMLKNMGI